MGCVAREMEVARCRGLVGAEMRAETTATAWLPATRSQSARARSEDPTTVAY
jgi:hypothetical protein